MKVLLNVILKAPKLTTPFKVYTYESGANGRHKVVNEWICRDITTWLMYMGLPAHLSKVACVPNEYIWKYCDKGNKNICEMHISDLVIYDKPRELSEFDIYCDKHCLDGKSCKHYEWFEWFGSEMCTKPTKLTRPPQSWCYVEELT